MATETKRRAPAKRPARRRDAPKHGGQPKVPKHAPSRKRLISAAQELVEERGYESLAVGQVWKRAGLSHQTFYNHFPDKRAVICAGEHEELAVIDAAIRRAQAAGEPWVGELTRSLDRALADLHGSTYTPRARLIAAMTKIAATDGIKAASVHQLARTAGVAAGEFQHHFSDRYDCLGAAVADAVGRLDERLGAIPDGDDLQADDPIASAEPRLAALIDTLASEFYLAALLLCEAGALNSPPRDGEERTDGPRGWAGSLRELIESRVLTSLSDAPRPQHRFAAGAIVAALRAVHLARGREGLRKATPQIVAAGLGPFAGSAESDRIARGAARTERNPSPTAGVSSREVSQPTR